MVPLRTDHMCYDQAPRMSPLATATYMDEDYVPWSDVQL